MLVLSCEYCEMLFFIEHYWWPLLWLLSKELQDRIEKFSNYVYINVNQLISLIPRAISEKCVFLCSNNWVKKQPPELLCKKVNISQISRENTFEEHMRTAASIGCLFRKVFQMQISRLEAMIKHVCKYKKPGFY